MYVTWRSASGSVVALDGLSFSVDEGEIVGLIGPNGAGKTTMFNCLSRLYRPFTGTITFDGKDVLAVPPHGIARLGIARTFQNLALFPSLTVLENLMIGAHTSGHVGFVQAALRFNVAREDRQLQRRALLVLSELGLDHLALPPGGGSVVRDAETRRDRKSYGVASAPASSRRAGERPHPRRS